LNIFGLASSNFFLRSKLKIIIIIKTRRYSVDVKKILGKTVLKKINLDFKTKSS
jgi:hypothetical protein